MGTSRGKVRGIVGVALGLMLGSMPVRAQSPPDSGRDMTFGEVVTDSLVGDVYAPGRWKPLSFGSFFSEGWDEPWAGGPRGQGGEGAPRQGWLNDLDGVFYRLAVAKFGYAHDVGNGDEFTSSVSVFTPFNRRFELRWDVPLVLANRGGVPGHDYHVTTPDLQLAPRFALSETENSAQSLDVTFRMPTGDTFNGQGQAAVTPAYNFWVNPWKGFVARGGAAFGVPFGHESVDEQGARTTFQGNLALGYYFTPHDMVPIGDMVWYVSTNVSTTIDHRGPNTTSLTMTPGFRVHMGDDWYALGGVELPVTQPQGSDYEVLGGLMKVW
ncbi:MAG TPA: hypothetical protein VGR62_00940 [Candidatus Binatia bacterium]|jgi:hypothetical protein|nr:hypothetical protein [Candidatus Binatia bacterium]